MKNRIRKCLSLAAVAVLCIAAGASAQNGLRARESSKTLKGLARSLAFTVVQHGADPTATGRPTISQKLVVQVPEPTAPVLLGADLLGLATLVFMFRKRMVFQRVRSGPECASEGKCE
ncbi:MAG: hypothetical protein ABSG32_14205 [Terriglobia bacterium]|jgi:hypothetical protein